MTCSHWNWAFCINNLDNNVSLLLSPFDQVIVVGDVYLLPNNDFYLSNCFEFCGYLNIFEKHHYNWWSSISDHWLMLGKLDIPNNKYLVFENFKILNRMNVK